MPSPTKGARFGGSPAHERLMLANLATALFEHGRITTTAAKARRLRPFAERLITKAKRGDLHNRREVMRVIRSKPIVHRLFADIAPFFDDRNGGYTRITKTMPRKGDNAPMAVIELIQQKTVTAEAERARRASGSRKAATTTADTKAEATEETTAEDTAAATEDATVTDAAVEESASTEDAPYGEGSHAPLEDDSQPEGYPIKGNASSMLYHTEDSPSYKQTKAEVWFATAEAAEAAGFSLPPSMQDKDDAKDES